LRSVAAGKPDRNKELYDRAANGAGNNEDREVRATYPAFRSTKFTRSGILSHEIADIARATRREIKYFPRAAIISSGHRGFTRRMLEEDVKTTAAILKQPPLLPSYSCSRLLAPARPGNLAVIFSDLFRSRTSPASLLFLVLFPFVGLSSILDSMRLSPPDYYHPRALAETRDYLLGPLTTEDYVPPMQTENPKQGLISNRGVATCSFRPELSSPRKNGAWKSAATIGNLEAPRFPSKIRAARLPFISSSVLAARTSARLQSSGTRGPPRFPESDIRLFPGLPSPPRPATLSRSGIKGKIFRRSARSEWEKRGKRRQFPGRLSPARFQRGGLRLCYRRSFAFSH
jgi:hypothetical protein